MTPFKAKAGSDTARIWAIVPAAGLGRRMGTAKQTLPYGSSTLAGVTVSNLLRADVSGVVVVTRSELVASLGLPRDPRLTIAYNEKTGTEMIDSIRIGLASLLGGRADEADGGDSSADPPPDGILVVPADQPGVVPYTYERCVAAFRNRPERIVIAAHAGKRGHPIIFPISLRGEVETIEGGLNLLRERRRDRVFLVEAGDAGVVTDLDTPEQYMRATKRPPGEAAR